MCVVYISLSLAYAFEYLTYIARKTCVYLLWCGLDFSCFKWDISHLCSMIELILKG